MESLEEIDEELDKVDNNNNKVIIIITIVMITIIMMVIMITIMMIRWTSSLSRLMSLSMPRRTRSNPSQQLVSTGKYFDIFKINYENIICRCY